jgi:hypothetical protein
VRADSIVDALERFFLDIVGTVIPGGAALLVVPVLFGGSIEIGPLSLAPWAGNFSWIVFILASYGAGHAVNSFGETMLTGPIEGTASRLRRILKGTRLERLAPAVVMSEVELAEKISESASFKALLAEVQRRYQWTPSASTDIRRRVRELRDVAMTIARDDLPTVYRFRFLSLLNLGLASVLLFTVAAKLVVSVAQLISRTADGSNINWWLLAGLFVLSTFFIERRYMFFGTSLRVPFSMAMGQLLVSHEGKNREIPSHQPKGKG